MPGEDQNAIGSHQASGSDAAVRPSMARTLARKFCAPACQNAPSLYSRVLSLSNHGHTIAAMSARSAADHSARYASTAIPSVPRLQPPGLEPSPGSARKLPGM